MVGENTSKAKADKHQNGKVRQVNAILSWAAISKFALHL
jgi:hypothetical protein